MTVAHFMDTGSFLIWNSNGHPKQTYHQLKKLHDYFNKTLFLSLKKKTNFKVAITEKYPRIPCELVADPLGSADHTLGTTYIINMYSLQMIRRGLKHVRVDVICWCCLLLLTKYCSISCTGPSYAQPLLPPVSREVFFFFSYICHAQKLWTPLIKTGVYKIQYENV